MIGDDVIREAELLASGLAADPSTPLTRQAASLLRLLASACLQENARRRLLAEAGAAPEAETGHEEARAMIRFRHEANGGDGAAGYGMLHFFRHEIAAAVGRIDRLEARCRLLEAMLSDAEDTLRARAEGRKAGLLEAAAKCQRLLDDDQPAMLHGMVAGLRDTFREMASPASEHREES